MGLEMVLSIKNELSVLRFLDAGEDAVSAATIEALAMQYHVCVRDNSLRVAALGAARSQLNDPIKSSVLSSHALQAAEGKYCTEREP